MSLGAVFIDDELQDKSKKIGVIPLGKQRLPLMKMEMKSFSRLGSKQQQKTILGAVLFMYLLTNTNIARNKFFYDPTCCFLADYGHGVSKV